MKQKKLAPSDFDRDELRTLSMVALLLNDMSEPKAEKAIALLELANDEMDMLPLLRAFALMLDLLSMHREMRRCAMVQYLKQADALIEVGQFVM